ncbi:hypothetical protein ACFYU8_18730 [Brevibacillus sp. NPDC003359]
MDNDLLLVALIAVNLAFFMSARITAKDGKIIRLGVRDIPRGNWD